MLKVLVCCFFLLIGFCTRIDGKCDSEKKITSISSGTSFGLCVTYCRRSINITSNPYQLVASKEPNSPQKDYPSVQKQYPYSSKQWNQLLDLFNLKAFRQLNETIGCPDCADGGAEWIEVNGKRVTFEYGTFIKGFEGLIKKLRELRDQYANNL